MKPIHKKKCLVVIILISIYILSRTYLAELEINTLSNLIYYCFFYLGDGGTGLNFRHILDITYYQCIFIVFLGTFFKDDLFVNPDMIFSRTHKRTTIYAKEIGKILLHSCLIYAGIYICIPTISYLIDFQSITKLATFNNTQLYIIHGLFLFCNYILIINIASILWDIKYVLIILIVTELGIYYLFETLFKSSQHNIYAIFQSYLLTGNSDYTVQFFIINIIVFIILNTFGHHILKRKEFL